MKKRIITLAGLMALSCALAVGCGNSTSQTETQSAAQTEAASETQVQTEETQEAESAAETTADTEATEAAATLEDGTYTADFNTDSSMFQVNEMYDGKGTLTVKDGKMTIHITLRSTNIVNLYPGLAEDAQKDGAELLQPVVECFHRGIPPLFCFSEQLHYTTLFGKRQVDSLDFLKKPDNFSNRRKIGCDFCKIIVSLY